MCSRAPCPRRRRRARWSCASSGRARPTARRPCGVRSRSRASGSRWRRLRMIEFERRALELSCRACVSFESV
eukprot:4142501-Prymnesium_polylepis.1